MDSSTCLLYQKKVSWFLELIWWLFCSTYVTKILKISNKEKKIEINVIQWYKARKIFKCKIELSHLLAWNKKLFKKNWSTILIRMLSHIYLCKFWNCVQKGWDYKVWSFFNALEISAQKLGLLFVLEDDLHILDVKKYDMVKNNHLLQ